MPGRRGLVKVAYWGNCRKSGVTCALTAIGLTAVLAYPFKITLFENHYNENGVLRYLSPRKWLYCVSEAVTAYGNSAYGNLSYTDCPPRFSGNFCETENYCENKDFYIMGNPYRKKENRRGGGIQNAYPVIELLEKGLYYVPQFTENADLYDYQFHFNLLPLLRRYQEIAFIDTHRENTLSSKVILEEADVVVVLLRQDMDEIQSFFQNYSSLIPKAFFIINDYQKKSAINLTKIVSEFGFQNDSIGVIPHSEEFQLAAAYGRMIEYISSNYNTSEERENRYFMQELKKTTFLLMQQVVFNRELGEGF